MERDYLKIAFARYLESHEYPKIAKHVKGYGALTVAIETDGHIITAEEAKWHNGLLSIPNHAVERAIEASKEILHFTARDEKFYPFNPQRIRMIGTCGIYRKQPMRYIGASEMNKETSRTKKITRLCDNCNHPIEFQLISDNATLLIEGQRYEGMGYCETCEKIYLTPDRTDWFENMHRVKAHTRNGVKIKAYWRANPK